jgi:putative nucleotidyltransferase with HDIG domain
MNQVPPWFSTALSDSGVNSLLNILKLQDEEAYLHSRQVALLTSLCLDEMVKKEECEWYGEQLVEIVKGALLHDIGKTFLPFGIQHSGKKLDNYMKEIMKIHPLLGYLSVRENGYSDIVKNIILLHHENANGTGYPINLEDNSLYTEENTPGYVWIVSYADRFDAMTSVRNFKPSMSYDEAWDELNGLRVKNVLPYKYAKYFHSVIKNLNMFPNF